MFMKKMELGFERSIFGTTMALKADCFEWLNKVPENSIHAVVTDPPYGVKEFDSDQIEKMEKGVGGIWRLPPSFDGNVRAPLPRFTALTNQEKERLKTFFTEWSKLISKVLLPGGHIFIATNTFLSQIVFSALVEGGLDYRGMVIRQVRTLRGGDRPKNAEEEFPDVCSMPRGCFEPWGLFRKPMLNNMKVSDCLREFGTGGIRRQADGRPFEDVILSERTPKRERDIADHPSLKPQSFLRQMVYAALPLGEGIILDPFMGSGSTIAAAEALGLSAIGIERHADYFNMAKLAIPHLAALTINQAQMSLEFA